MNKQHKNHDIEKSLIAAMLGKAWMSFEQIRSAMALTREQIPVVRNLLTKMTVHRGAFDRRMDNEPRYRLKRLIYSGNSSRDWLECERDFGFKAATGTPIDPGIITTDGRLFGLMGMLFFKEDLRNIYIELSACGFSPRSVPVSTQMRFVKINPIIGELTFQEHAVIRIMGEIEEILKK